MARIRHRLPFPPRRVRPLVTHDLKPVAAVADGVDVDSAVQALRTAGIPAEIERSLSGQLQVTLRGEAVDAWRDDAGPYVIVAVHE